MYKQKESNQLTSIDSKSLQNRFWKDNAGLSVKNPSYFPHSDCQNSLTPNLWQYKSAK